MTASAPDITGPILVLGGAGFIGSNLVTRLVAQGQRPRVFARPSRSGANLRTVMDKIDLIHGDFMDDAVLRVALRGVHTVFHLITTTFPNMVIESSNYDLLSNLLPTIRLMEMSREMGVRRIVYASSGGTVYGEPQQIPIPEHHPLAPKSAYGQSKLTIENYLSFYARTTPLEVSILRMSNPYGPQQNIYGAQGLLAVAMGCVLDGRALKVFGAGHTVRDYIYIDDVVEAMLKATVAAPGILNISSGEGRTVNDVIAAVEAASGRPILRQPLPERPGDVAVSILDNQRARQLLAWTPSVPFGEGVARSWAALQGSSG
ncbi:NAD-dependent epimerase/dehydratase family protein [Roseateles sp. P5_E7]